MVVGEDRRATLVRIAPDAEWSNPRDALLIRETFHAEIHLSKDSDPSGIALHLGGGPEASAFVQDAAAVLNGYVLDSSAGEWMHHMQDPDAGRAQFNVYLETVRAQIRSSAPIVQAPRRGLFARLFRRGH